MPKKTLNAYLAGPDVFFPDPIDCGQRKKDILKNYNIIGHYPFDNEINDEKDPVKFAYAIAEANELMIEKCDIIFANLDPWHGPSADNGTCFEIGYLSAIARRSPEKMIIGYYSKGIPANFAARVSAQIYGGDFYKDTDGRLLSAGGFTIENFGLQDNLMPIYAIHKTGGEIFATFDEAAGKTQELWEKKQRSTKPMFTPMFNRNILIMSSLVVLGAACAVTAWSRPVNKL